jgi:ATP-dependent Clp protease ATP-binding subunit ClpB
VFNILLQLLDDGRLTDSQGRMVDFKNTVVIMTSNIGSHLLLEELAREDSISESVRTSINQLMHQYFKPEFLNRLDEIVLFSPLRMEDIKEIISMYVKSIQKRVAFEISLSQAAVDKIASESYNPAFGARPIKRYIQKNLETLLAKALIKGEISDAEKVLVDVVNGLIQITPVSENMI